MNDSLEVEVLWPIKDYPIAAFLLSAIKRPTTSSELTRLSLPIINTGGYDVANWRCH